MPTNTNVLKGMRCPQCGALEPFSISADACFDVTDDGVEQDGDVEWDGDSHCHCKTCGHSGQVRGFHIPPEPAIAVKTRYILRIEQYAGEDTGLDVFCEGQDHMYAVAVATPAEGLHIVDYGYPTAEAAHAAWPEALLPSPA